MRRTESVWKIGSLVKGEKHGVSNKGCGRNKSACKKANLWRNILRIQERVSGVSRIVAILDAWFINCLWYTVFCGI